MSARRYLKGTQALQDKTVVGDVVIESDGEKRIFRRVSQKWWASIGTSNVYAVEQINTPAIVIHNQEES